MEQLPTSLRDVCEICIALGLRFLWVDCLCIMQDSEEDWIEQSAVMGMIFSGAEFTIRAAAGKDCDSGLFTKRSWYSDTVSMMRCRDL
jgi:Heterokaryon incompatibility protein (HET)